MDSGQGVSAARQSSLLMGEQKQLEWLSLDKKRYKLSTPSDL